MNSMVRKADAEFGKALVGAARDAHQESTKVAVVSQVTKLLTDIERCEQTINRLEAGVALAKRKLKAVEEGEFQVLGTTIRYSEADLNSTLGTEEIIRLASTYL